MRVRNVLRKREVNKILPSKGLRFAGVKAYDA
jgi:hypothetical protein